MKQLLSIFLAVLAVFSYGMGTKIPTNIPVVVWQYTNEPPVTNGVVQEPVAPVSDNALTVIAQGAFARPSIAVNQGTVAVSSEGADQASIWVYKLVSGKWQGGRVVEGSLKTAKRVYVPDTCIGKDGTVYTSFRYGPKTGGVYQGPGTFINGKETFTRFTTGGARLASDGKSVFMLAKNGAYGQVGLNGEITPLRSLQVGSSGEKMALAISGTVTAACHNGYSKESSRLVINGKVYTWADYATYSAQSDDLCYPTVWIASNGVVYVASIFDGALYLNGVQNGKLMYPASALLKVADATMEERCPPRMANGYIFWTYKGQILRKKLPLGQLSVVCKGSYPDVTEQGNKIHMVYVANGALNYKVIE